MKAIFTQAGPGLSISQGGLGPIVQLGFGASGAPATLSNAPQIEDLAATDNVLVNRAGQLFSITWSNFIAAVSAAIGVPSAPTDVLSFDFDEPGGIPALLVL